MQGQCGECKGAAAERRAVDSTAPPGAPFLVVRRGVVLFQITLGLPARGAPKGSSFSRAGQGRGLVGVAADMGELYV